MSKKQIVLLLEERWRTERMYQDLKGEFGFVAEQARAFSPSTARQTGADSNVIPAPKALSSFHHVLRLAFARVLVAWLPRCPLCHRPNSRSATHDLLGANLQQ